MTGMTAHTNGLAGLANPGWEWSLPESVKTLVDDFNQHGYETVHSGMQHERQSKHANRYEHVLQSEGWVESAVDAAIAYLKQRSAGNHPRPFYLNIGTNEVHSGQWETYKHDRDHDRGKTHYGSADPDSLNLPEFLPDFPEIRREWAAFHGCVRYWDEHIGRLLDAVDSLDLADNTLIILTTDHGVATHRGKGTLYREGTEIALAVRGPGIAPRSRSDALIPNIDFLPTILEACQVPVRPEIEGRSFLPLLQGKPYEENTSIFLERNFHDDFDPMRAVRTKDFLFVENFDPTKPRCLLPQEVRSLSPEYRTWFTEMWPEVTEQRPTLELFDRRNDPQEWINVATEEGHAEIRDNLRRQLKEWMEQTKDPILETSDPEGVKAILKERTQGCGDSIA